MKKYLFIFVVTFCFLFSSVDVFADTSLKYKLIEPLPFVDKNTDLPKYLESLFKLSLASIGIAALLMIVIGGYYYMVSAGNQAKVSNAKILIWDAILGFVVVLFVAILFYEINPDILKFKPIFPEKEKGVHYQKKGFNKPVVPPTK